jgi:hypothetical protein
VTPPYNSTNFVGGNGTRLQHDFFHRVFRWFSPKIKEYLTAAAYRLAANVSLYAFIPVQHLCDEKQCGVM